MRSICFFSSYFNQPVIPYYIKFYLENLLPYFSDIVFITNEKLLDDTSLTFLKEKNIQLMYVANEGYDFGMWYKAFNQIDIKSFDRIGLINDSCVLFTKPIAFFEWLNKTDIDCGGMVDSNAISYHLQSFFLVINKKAITSVTDYFYLNGIINDLKQVIKTYEIGLSQYLINKGFKVDAFYSTKEYTGEFSPMFYMPVQLINNGLPLIKKKIIFCSFRKDEYLNLMRMKFRIYPGHYIKAILKKYDNHSTLIDFNKVLENRLDLSFYLKILKYSVESLFFQIIRKFKFFKKS